MADEKCIHCGRDDEGDVLACDLILKLRAVRDERDTLSAENKVLRAFCFSLGSEAGVSYDEVKELLDPASTQRSDSRAAYHCPLCEMGFPSEGAKQKHFMGCTYVRA